MNRVSALLKGFSVLRVLRHPAMLRLWIAQVIYLSVQFTASYAMIVLITNLTGSATMVGLVLIALSLPIFLLGAPAGTLVDRLDKRKVLWMSNVVRACATALFVGALLWKPDGYIAIYILAFLFSLVGLFFTPAEAAIIPGFVDESELLPALSLYNLTLNISQAVGLLVFGPLALNLISNLNIPLGHSHTLVLTAVDLLFMGITVLYLVAALLTAGLPEARGHVGGEEARRSTDSLIEDVKNGSLLNFQAMWVDFKESWRLVRRSKPLVDGLWQACFGSLIMLAVAQLATSFVQKLLDLPVKDTALVFAPAGVGLLAGAVLVPTITTRLGANRTLVVGMIGAGIGLTILPIAQIIARHADPAHWQSNAIFLIAMIITSLGAGACLDLIIVPAQTIVQEESPDSMRGRVQSLYQALFNGGSIPVVLFIGAVADLLGIVDVMFLMAFSCLVAAALTVWRLSRRDGFNRKQQNKQEELNVSSEQELSSYPKP